MSGVLLLPFLGFGLVVVAFPVLVLVLLVSVVQLRRQVRRLQERLDEVERARREPAVPPATAVPDATETRVPPVVPAVEPTPAAPPTPEAAPPVESPPARVEPVTAPGGVGRFEGRLGGAWLSRVGALVLVLGIGFFLKYAVENDWIGPAGRVATGVVVGLLLVVVGERLQGAASRLPAQGLAAAGIGALYLSVYAAYGFYALVPASLAFVAMAAVTAIGMAVAVRHDAQAIALLAGLGGFLTPVVLSSGTDPAVTLFTYLGVLDAGLLAAASRRGWTAVALVSFAATQWLYWGWFGEWYEPSKLAVALVAASVFFLLFAAVAPGIARAAVRTVGGFGAQLLVLGVPTLYFLTAREILAPDHTRGLALLCLVLAAAYLVAARGLRRGEPVRGNLVLLHGTLALVFLTLALAVHFAEHSLAVAWSVEGAALLWGGFRRGAPKLRMGALAVLVLAWTRWFALLAVGAGHTGGFLVGHPAFPATVAVAAAASLAAVLYRRREASVQGWEVVVGPTFTVVAVASGALFVSAELSQFPGLGLPLAYVRVLTTVVWTIATLPLLALAAGDRTRILLASVTVLLAAVGLRAIAADLAGWDALSPELRRPVLNPRFLGGLVVVVLYGLYARIVPEFPFVGAASRSRLGALASGGAVLLLLWNLSAELMLMPLPSLAHDQAAKLRGTGLSILWALYAFVMMGIGLWRRRASLRMAAIALFGLTVAKVLVVDLSALDAAYRILSFLVLGALLILASFLYTRHHRRSVPGDTPEAPL